MFDNLMDNTPTTSLSDDELQCYLAKDVENVKDGLMWWYGKHALFPHLSCMACDYLAIPSEYLFSCVYLRC